MSDVARIWVAPLTLIILAGCATHDKPPPAISLDEPVAAELLPEPPNPVEVIAVPEPLALPAPLTPLPGTAAVKTTTEPADETVRVARATAEHRGGPTREG